MDDREIVYYNHNSFSPFRFRFKLAFVELYQKLLYNLLLYFWFHVSERNSVQIVFKSKVLINYY